MRRNQGDRDKDAAALEISFNVIRSLVTAVTKAMKNFTANAMVPVSVTPKTITYFSAIDLYNNESLKTKTKEENY